MLICSPRSRPGVMRAVMLATAFGCASAPPAPMGAALLADGQIIEAEAAFRAEIAANPGNAAARDGLGAALAAQDRYDQACPLLALDSHPLNAPACWLKAMDLARRQTRWGVVAAHGKRVDPRSWPHAQQLEFYGMYTEALRQLKDFDQLILVYPQMLGAAPEDADAHYYYAKALEVRGQNERALREYELVLELDPERGDVARYVARLQEGMRQSGRSAATTVEHVDSAAGQSAATITEAGVTLESWTGGSVVAAISVDAMPGTGFDGAVTAPDVSVITAHWPRGENTEQIVRQIAGYASSFKCPLPAGAAVSVTWGPDGLVKESQLEGVPPHVRACVQRNVNGWLLPVMRGGYLKVRVPIATTPAVVR